MGGQTYTKQWSMLIKGSFTYSDWDCESDVTKIGFIAFLYYFSHLVMVNIKGKVTSQSQPLYVNEPLQCVSKCGDRDGSRDGGGE